MKKVAFFIESNAVGGAERVLHDIVKRIDKQRFDITVISLFKNPVYRCTSQILDNFDCSYRWIINNEKPLYSKIGNYCIHRFPNIFYKLLIRSKYDVLIAFYEGMPTTFISRIKTKSKKIAWLHTSVDLSLKERTTEIIQEKRLIYSSFDKIIGVSQGVVNGFVDLFPMLQRKVLTVYNPIDPERIKKLANIDVSIIKDDIFTFVSVGRVIPCKGYERLIGAAQVLKRDGFRFRVWIIGGGGHAHLEKQTREKGVQDYFVFMGNQSNPYVYMKKADCVISSSSIEGLSTVLVEALILDKLTVATNFNGTLEIIGMNSDYGILVDNSEEGVLMGMRKVLSDKKLKPYYEKKAQERSAFFSDSCGIQEIEKCLGD